jgi:hypothetical protein
MSKTLGPPMTLANMRANGVRAVIATCEACGHKADVNVDALPENVFVPEAVSCPVAECMTLLYNDQGCNARRSAPPSD